MTINAFVFPGQGSQSVGMGKELFQTFREARDVFHEVDEVLSLFLTKLIFEGPIEELTLTENTQPAIMAMSVAVFRVLEKQGGKSLSHMAKYVAGHSLGEYSALCAAGVLTLKDTALLLRTRGEAMQLAVPKGKGAMAALIGADIVLAKTLCEKVKEMAPAEVCEIANDNSDGQVVISGTKEGIALAETISKELNIKRCVLLNVSAPFHSSLMITAARTMENALGNTQMFEPSVPVVANITASTVTEPDEIRDLLVQQVTGTVRWRESVQYLHQHGVTRTVEVGPGKVLSGLTSRCVKDMSSISINTPEDVESFLKQMG